MPDKISIAELFDKSNTGKDPHGSDHIKLRAQELARSEQRKKLEQELPKHQETAETLRNTYRTLSKNIEVARAGTLSSDFVDNYNHVADTFNKVRAELVAFNKEIKKYNAAQLKGISTVELLKLPQKIELLNETQGPSKPSSKTGNLIKMLGMGYLALSSPLMLDPASARPITALAEINQDGFLPREPMYPDHHFVTPPRNSYKDVLTSIAMEHRSLVQRDITYGDILISQTENAKVYATDNSNDTMNVAKAIAQTVETDNTYLANIFGGIKPKDLPFTIYVQSGIDGAYHYSCDHTDLFVGADTQLGPGFNAAEMVEVYEAAINNGWDCGSANGESLSRALAIELDPALGPFGMTNNAIEWFNKGAYDYISTNLATDLDHEANGCGTLFIEYLHDELEQDWKRIVAAGGSTLAETYSKLTGNDSTTAFPNFKEALQPFINEGQLVPPEVGKSWSLQVQEKQKAQEKQKRKKRITIEKAVAEGSGGVGGGILLAGAAYYIWQRRRQQRASLQPQTELGEINADTANTI